VVNTAVNILIKSYLRLSIGSIAVLLVSGCSYIPFFGDDDDEVVIELREPVLLVDFTKERSVYEHWDRSGGGSNDTSASTLTPLLDPKGFFFADNNSKITRYDIATGETLWSNKIDNGISGGVGGNAEAIVVGDGEGNLSAYSAADGSLLWAVELSSEVLAVSAADSDIVVIRTNDNRVYAIELLSGKKVWQVNETPPALTIRGASRPVIHKGTVYAGFDNGKLLALDLQSGRMLWDVRVSTPSGRTELDRLVDLDGVIAVDDDLVFAASYHGRVVAVARTTGKVLWTRDIASISGVTSDGQLIYLSDRDSQVWALQRYTGTTEWKQEKLLYRQASLPISIGAVVMVGDFEGYLHLLAKEDGRFVGRAKIAKRALSSFASPSDEGIGYITDITGRFAAYSQAPNN